MKIESLKCSSETLFNSSHRCCLANGAAQPDDGPGEHQLDKDDKDGDHEHDKYNSDDKDGDHDKDSSDDDHHDHDHDNHGQGC